MIIKIGIHSFPAQHSEINREFEVSTVCGREAGRWQLDSIIDRVLLLPPCQENLVKKRFNFKLNNYCMQNMKKVFLSVLVPKIRVWQTVVD